MSMGRTAAKLGVFTVVMALLTGCLFAVFGAAPRRFDQ